MGDPLRRHVGCQLAGASRRAPHARVRHPARAPGRDRARRARPCGAQPRRHLPRADDHGSVSGEPHGHVAVRSLRLRRARRRLDRGRGFGRRRGARPPASRRAHQRRGERHPRPPGVGSVGGSGDHGGARRRRAALGAHRPEARRRRHHPALRRLQLVDARLDRGARLLPPRRRRTVRRGRARASRRRAAAQHVGRTALGRTPPRLRLPRRGDAPAPRRVWPASGEGLRGRGRRSGRRADRGMSPADALSRHGESAITRGGPPPRRPHR
jgi:hypothetical protein